MGGRVELITTFRGGVFETGDIVTIIDIDAEDNTYLVRGGCGVDNVDWVHPSDMKAIEKDPTDTLEFEVGDIVIATSEAEDYGEGRELEVMEVDTRGDGLPYLVEGVDTDGYVHGYWVRVSEIQAKPKEVSEEEFDDTEGDMEVILKTVHPLLRRLPYNRSSIVELVLLTLIDPEASEQLLEDALFHVEDELELVRGR